MKYKLIQSEKQKLIIFFSGFALDYNPFSIITSYEYDILFIYGYSSDNFSSLPDFIMNYENITIIGYSFGAYISGHYMDKISKEIKEKINGYYVINGSYDPVSDNYGIPERIFNMTLKSINTNGIDNFYKNLFDNENHYLDFLKNKPETGDFIEELLFFKSFFNISPPPKIMPDCVMVSQKDRIINAVNQLRYWNLKETVITETETAHFPFYNYKSWDNLIDELLTRG